jgi:hypothetical protein
MKDELERLMLAHSPRLRAIPETTRERIQAGAGIPDEEFWKDIEGTRKPKKNGPKVAKEREP